jgi:hypothetical protein
VNAGGESCRPFSFKAKRPATKRNRATKQPRAETDNLFY